MTQPRVSVVIPSYNRAHLILGALTSLTEQKCREWEAIVVDDGSADNTREVVEKFAASSPNPVRYVWQKNAGCGAARNTGIDHARGEFLSFLDSDDQWAPVHLSDCIAGLDANPELSRVFGATKLVEIATARELVGHSFHEADGAPRPILSLKTRQSGPVKIIDDPDLLLKIFGGLTLGHVPASVYRAGVFKQLRFPLIGASEDSALTMMMVAMKMKMGYLDQVSLIYRLHDSHLSGTAGADWKKQWTIQTERSRAFECLVPLESQLTPQERKALTKRRADIPFWALGYAVLWANGETREAMRSFHHGLAIRPTSPAMWKTYLICLARYVTGTAPKKRPATPKGS